ncbi:MAG: pyruvate kinase [Saprospiraceae bacterium]|nr:pyruvate kinase [Saprospiraceae bacterium]
MLNTYKKKTKIVVTLGPASRSFETMIDLVRAGANVFRLNFSHGSHSDHKESIDNILRFKNELHITPSILADLQGPKIRLGENLNEEGEDGIEVAENEIVTFTTNANLAKPLEKIFEIRLETFANDVTPGEKILIDDGKMEFRVVETDGKENVKLKALNGGLVKSKKGVNLPETKLSVPSLTKKDREDLEFIMTQPVDWLALSFVRSAQDIIELREILDANNNKMRIIAKIEKPEAIDDIDAIIAATDGVMVARGDLGVEVPFEKVPIMQKEIVKKCIQLGKPVIIATQVMESMIENPKPTRAEITDVSNVVLEGADAVMLSGETSVGKHPVRVVQTIAKTVLELEKTNTIYNKNLLPNKSSDTFLADAICYNAAKTAIDLDAKAIVAMTKSGFTARMIASYRPQADIYAFTDDENKLSQLSLLWGVQAFYYDGKSATDEALPEINNILKIKGLLERGDVVINTASMPLHSEGRTNMLKVSIVE